MSERLNQLAANIDKVLGKRVQSIEIALGEVTVLVNADTYYESAMLLRDDPLLAFEQLIDLCGVDYQDFREDKHTGKRFGVVAHLLSLAHNWRLRVRVFAADDSYPVVASITPVWNSANWFEREAFDLYGILFDGHDDLRRILTDYGFIGHPFRKDFPISVSEIRLAIRSPNKERAAAEIDAGGVVLEVSRENISAIVSAPLEAGSVRRESE